MCLDTLVLFIFYDYLIPKRLFELIAVHDFNIFKVSLIHTYNEGDLRGKRKLKVGKRLVKRFLLLETKL